MWSSFGPFWSVKYLNFPQKLPIWTAHHTFLESKHSGVTKNLYYVLSPEGSQKKVSAHGLRFYNTPCALQLVETFVSEYLNFN